MRVEVSFQMIPNGVANLKRILALRGMGTTDSTPGMLKSLREKGIDLDQGNPSG